MWRWASLSIRAFVDSNWNVMAQGDARKGKRRRNWRMSVCVALRRARSEPGGTPEGKWRGNWRMEWVAGTLHTISEHGVSSITTADAHNSAASSRLNWRSCRFKWTRPFRRKTKSGFWACAIIFQLAFTTAVFVLLRWEIKLHEGGVLSRNVMLTPSFMNVRSIL